MLNRWIPALNHLVYEQMLRPLLFRRSAMEAHQRLLTLLAWADEPLPSSALGLLRRLVRARCDVAVGGVLLPQSLILAAGLVKGEGFDSESAALAAVESGRCIMPGWRSVPRLLGPVEFGSFTRWPRQGNAGVTLWRDPATRSTQNRVGLRNPGVLAAAAFLARHRDSLPPVFGINIAISPGVTDLDQELQEARESIAAFVRQGIRPSWFTLNVSCPNTEDDPGARQTEQHTRRLCRAVVELLNGDVQPTPLWVKVGPGLAAEQYGALMRVFADEGVRAVIATNTHPEPTPDDPALMAGVGGGRLHARALAAAGHLLTERQRRGYAVDVIGCGGVIDAASYHAFRALGVAAVQYWSALVYRGPLAAAVIESEFRHAESDGARRSGAARN